MSTATQALGELGERVAARWMRQRGWEVTHARFRSGRRDLDLVARRGDSVAFVEVKCRRDARFGGPLGAVHWRKQRELSRSARDWIARHGRSGESYRFDVLGILVRDGAVRVKHVESAFVLPSRA